MKKDAGITLLEMLVVVTLVGLLAAVTAPAVGSGIETVKLRSSAERLASTMRLARERAVRTRHYQQVTVDPQTRRVELRDLEGDYARAWEIPETIAVQLKQPLFLQFAPDGGVPELHVELQNSRRRMVSVEMDAFTALPSVKEVAQ
jgi:type II secretion system protein H